MIFTHDIADQTGRFLVRLVPSVAHIVHGVENSPMHGLQSITHVRQRTTDDDAHGVGHEGLTHLIFDINRNFLRL